MGQNSHPGVLPSGIDWDGTLQNYPTRLAIYGARRAGRRVTQREPRHAISEAKRGPRHEMSKEWSTIEPIGPLIGVLLTVDKGWPVGDAVHLGPFSVDPVPEEEHLITLVPASHWKQMQTLEFRVHGLHSEVAPTFLPERRPPITFAGTAGRATRWRPCSGLPESTFSDSRRGLGITASDDGVVMHWYHAREADIFDEVGDAGFLRTVMTRRAERVAVPKGWYQADPTKFTYGP